MLKCSEVAASLGRSGGVQQSQLGSTRDRSTSIMGVVSGNKLHEHSVDISVPYPTVIL